MTMGSSVAGPVFAVSRGEVSRTRRRYPGRDVRVIFPIDPEDFFIEGSAENNGRRRLSVVAAVG